MECVGAAVYANVLFTDRIVRIVGPLREDELVPGSPLNGIAAVPVPISS
ncbi:hypothetical protein [Streptomyces sp. NPDC002769]